ncbi:hypothetical protein GCM10008932_07160 [Alkalibacterium iburiense]|uniref:TerB N-terminal domain-containing protein n=1 Tax=Alkalibacterium iburiense TaxID=290589 RepID=A0ABN0X736_9LACT
MKILNFFKRKAKKLSAKTPQKENQLSEINFTLHNDIKDIIWIKNGPKKNFNSDKVNKITEFEIGGIRYTIKTSVETSEPSAIDIELPITKDVIQSDVSKLPYYPAYSSLSPDQRSNYLHYLSNPYNSSYDIGYVFLLYYGLERFLLGDKYEEAFHVINKLREVHKNESFQYYSGNALILSCIYKQRPDMMTRFIESSNKEYKLKFSDNLFLLSAYSFRLPLNSTDIIRLSKTFEFTNKRYISKYPELFNKTLLNIIEKRYDRNSILLNDILKKKDYDKLRTEEMRMFANVSISEKEINIPLLTESFIIKKTFYDLLYETHETVKVELADLRKEGKAPKDEKKKKSKKNTILTFDKVEESELLNELNNTRNNIIDRHFTYIKLQNFYYKYRGLDSNLDSTYIDECIRYCKEDIKSLNDLQKAYVNYEPE